jgi:hypothetical protein
MLFNDLLVLELLILLSTIFYVSNNNIMMLLYTGGLYLILVGLYCLLNDADIYIGFLWVIDLGVGLIFFIFIIHFTSFLHQKALFNLSARHFFFTYLTAALVLTFSYYFASPADNTFYGDLSKTWFFRITYLDYYTVFYSNEVTDLNTLRDTYFLLNGFEFFVVNFSLFFGLIASILMCFIIHRVFNFLNYSQIKNMDVLRNTDSGFFIRSQNFITQQNTAAAVRVWSKSKKKL